MLIILIKNVLCIFYLVSKYLGILVSSIVSHTVYLQLEQLGDYYLNYFNNTFNGVLTLNHPHT